MKKVTEKTKECQYDIQIVQQIRQFLEEKFGRGDYGKSRETIQEFYSMLKSFIESMQYEEIETERYEKETEEEARQYFGTEFIEKFEEIRKYCTDNNLIFAIHGTSPLNLDSIQENGLLYDRPELLSTTLIQEGTDSVEVYKNYTGLLNWAHREWKGLVLLGIPAECNGILLHGEKETKPLWEKIAKNGKYEGKYRIKPEFIIGQIDVDKKNIRKNLGFMLEHDYTGLKYDNDLTDYGRKLSITIEEAKKIVERAHQEQVDDSPRDELESDEKREKSVEEILIDIDSDLKPVTASLIRAKGKMLEKNIDEYAEIIEQTINNLKKITPQLKENCEITAELEQREDDNIEEWDDDMKWDDEWDVDSDRDDEEDSFMGSFIEDMEENISQRATISGINKETQYIKFKNRDRSELETGIARDEE